MFSWSDGCFGPVCRASWSKRLKLRFHVPRLRDLSQSSFERSVIGGIKNITLVVIVISRSIWVLILILIINVLLV